MTLIERLSASRWRALARPAKRLQEGDRLHFGHDGRVCLPARSTRRSCPGEAGEVDAGLRLSGADLDAAIARRADAAAAVHCRRGAPEDADRSDYQTMYAAREGAVAAPTAGLHFTPELVAALDAADARHFVTLHVGAGTFLPVKAEDTERSPHAHRVGRGDRRDGGAVNAARAAAAASSRSARRRCDCSSRAAPDGTIRPFRGRPTSSSRRATASAPSTS